MSTIGFVGGGNMGQALIKGIIRANLYKPRNVFVSDVRQERLDFLAKTYGVRAVDANGALAAEVDVLVLSVKPQTMTEALEGIKDVIRSDTLVISIAAGIKISNVTDVLGDMAVVRVMPNTPALIGQGASALFANDRAKPILEKAVKIFSAVGRAVIVESEDLMDAVTAVSGSGPAYYFLLTEEMIKAGVELGLSEDVAKELVLQTAKGAALLAAEADKDGQSPAELRRKVTSPGGTTEAALKVFADGNFGQLTAAAVKRARDRGRELSAESKD